MKNPFYRLVTGFLCAAVVGLVLAAVYGKLPCVVTAVLAPCFQSPWELSKLAYFPLLCAVALTRSTAKKDRVPLRADLMLLSLTPLALFFALWATAPLEIGNLRLLLWLAVLLAGFLVTGRVKQAGKNDSVWWALVVALGVAYVLFTLFPPAMGPFLDPRDVAAMATLPC